MEEAITGGQFEYEPHARSTAGLRENDLSPEPEEED
jgi:hypothetical protein